MQITQNKKDELNMSVSITLEQADYADDKKKKLNSYRRNAELKGFRKGMAPMSLVEKIYGGQALSEVLNEMVSDKIRGFIDENKLNILGEPLPAENQEERRPEDGDFTFTFDLGLAPEFTVDVTAEDKIPVYTIIINDKAKADYRESLLKQIGSVKEGEDGKKELVAAEANQESFDKLFGPDTVHNEEEFAQKIEESLKREYVMESDYRFSVDVRDILMEKAAISLPDDFLKRWLFTANDGKFTMEQIEKEYDLFAKDFRWQMIRTKLMQAHELKVEKEDMVEASKDFARYQFAMYGLNSVPDDDLAGFATRLLEDPEQQRRIYEKVENDKVMAFVRNTATLENKECTIDEMRAMPVK